MAMNFVPIFAQSGFDPRADQQARTQALARALAGGGGQAPQGPSSQGGMLAEALRAGLPSLGNNMFGNGQPGQPAAPPVNDGGTGPMAGPAPVTRTPAAPMAALTPTAPLAPNTTPRVASAAPSQTPPKMAYHGFSGFEGMPDLSASARYSRGNIDGVSGFVMHHTGGRGTPQGVIDTLNQRGLGVQFVMDRDGSIYRTLPDGARGAHMMLGAGKGSGLSNANTLGMEVIARDNSDVTPEQVKSGQAFLAAMKKQYPELQVFGHGEVNPGHKQADEGLAIINAFRAAAGAPPVSADDMAAAPPDAPVPQNRSLGGYQSYLAGESPPPPAPGPQAAADPQKLSMLIDALMGQNIG